MQKMNDPIGRAISDFYDNGEAPDIKIHTNYTEGELLSPAYFFRTETEMPEIEKKALSLCRGKVLDIGAAAGCHTLVLQKKGFDVTALEKSAKAAEVLKKRGIKKIECTDVLHFYEKEFDTIILLMNGTGIGGTLNGLEQLLRQLRNMLNTGGQILIDSSDIRYLFEEEDGSVWIDLANDAYFGEMEYELTYKTEKSKFNWLFVDFETLTETAAKAGMKCNLVLKGKHFSYLAQITLL